MPTDPVVQFFDEHWDSSLDKIVDQHIVSAENSKLNVIWQHSMDISIYSSTTPSHFWPTYNFCRETSYGEHLIQYKQIALYCMWSSSDHQDETEQARLKDFMFIMNV
jgi:hypothetical protein